jgi:hypothetical protein
MLQNIIFQYTNYSSAIICLLFGIKLYLFFRYKGNDWRIVNLLYFSRNDIKRQRELETIKSTQNNLSLSFSMLLFLLVLILVIK